MSVFNSSQRECPSTPAIKSGAPLRNPAEISRFPSATPFFNKWFGTEKQGIPALESAFTTWH